MLVTSILILLAFPALTVGLIFLLFDRFFGTHFYVASAGATPILWQHLFWLFGHPEVYIMALPAFGIISEVMPTFSRKPLFGYPMMAYSICLIAFLSYGVWGHHMFATGMGPVADSAFAITSMLIAIPTGVKIFSWIATVWGGSLRMTTSFYFALGHDPRVHHRRTQRNHARRRAPIDLAADRFLLRRRAFSLRAVRRRDVRDPGGLLLLVAEDHRPDAQRDASASGNSG